MSSVQTHRSLKFATAQHTIQSPCTATRVVDGAWLGPPLALLRVIGKLYYYLPRPALDVANETVY